MRKMLVTLVAIGAAATMLPGHAGADDKQAMIQLPAPFVGLGHNAGAASLGCVNITDPACEKGSLAGLHRRIYINSPGTAQSANAGVVGFTLPISRRNVSFTLRSVPPGSADFDIFFYRSLGAPPNGEADTDFGEGAVFSFAHFGNGAETGTVPPGATFAIVTLWGSANATFSYTS